MEARVDKSLSATGVKIDYKDYKSLVGSLLNWFDQLKTANPNNPNLINHLNQAKQSLVSLDSSQALDFIRNTLKKIVEIDAASCENPEERIAYPKGMNTAGEIFQELQKPSKQKLFNNIDTGGESFQEVQKPIKQKLSDSEMLFASTNRYAAFTAGINAIFTSVVEIMAKGLDVLKNWWADASKPENQPNTPKQAPLYIPDSYCKITRSPVGKPTQNKDIPAHKDSQKHAFDPAVWMNRTMRAEEFKGTHNLKDALARQKNLYEESQKAAGSSVQNAGSDSKVLMR